MMNIRVNHDNLRAKEIHYFISLFNLLHVCVHRWSLLFCAQKNQHLNIFRTLENAINLSAFYTFFLFIQYVAVKELFIAQSILVNYS